MPGERIDSRSIRVAALMDIHSQYERPSRHRAWSVLGLALGIVVSVTTDVPLAPEAGLVLGALIGLLACRGM
jgi:hypothetical protein